MYKLIQSNDSLGQFVTELKLLIIRIIDTRDLKKTS